MGEGSRLLFVEDRDADVMLALITFVNDAACRLLGESRQQLQGYLLTPPASATEARALLMGGWGARPIVGRRWARAAIASLDGS